MVSYTRLLLLVLVGIGTPLFLLFQGSMNLGQQIAAGTVLLAFLSLFVFSGRKPLPTPPKSPIVEVEETVLFDGFGLVELFRDFA